MRSTAVVLDWYSGKRSDQFSRLDHHIYLTSPTFSSSTPSSLLLPLPTSSESILPSKKYSPIGPLGWVGGPQENDTLSGPIKRGLGGGWEAGGAAAVVMSCGGVRVQPAEVQASRVREYVVHGSRRRNRKLRDSPLNSRFPSLYRWYICKNICIVLTVAICILYPCMPCPVFAVNLSLLIADYELWWCHLESSADPSSTVRPCLALSAPLWSQSGVLEKPPKSWCPPKDWTRYLKGYT